MGVIKKLEVKNLIGIKEKVLFPGKVNIIKGKNGTGKTALLEAIEIAYKNNLRRVNVIKEGHKDAEIIIETDDNLEIRRRITNKRNPVTVKENGFQQNAPQSFLDDIAGKYSFNPVEFIAADSEEQTKMLLDSIDIKITQDQIKEWIGDNEPLPPVDYSNHGLEVMKDIYDNFYDKRADQNKKVKMLSEEYAVEKRKVPDDFNADEFRDISLKDKYNELRDSQDYNKKLEKSAQTIKELEQNKENKIQSAEQIHKDADNEVDKIKIQIEQLEKGIKSIKNKATNDFQEAKIEIRAIEERITKGQEYLKNNKGIDTENLETEVEKFEENKNLVSIHDKAERLLEETNEEGNYAAKLDKIVKMLKDKPKELIAATDIPIEGLEIRDGLVYIDDRAVKDYSKGEKIPLAVNFARMLSNKDKVIILDEITSLDPDNLEIFMEEIMNDEFQYWITEPSSDTEMIIEGILADGRKIDVESGELKEEVN